MRHPLASGYLALAFAQIAISVNVVVSKYLLSFTPMFMLLASRFLISTLIFIILMKTTGTTILNARHPLGKLTTHDWWLTLLQGLFAAFLFNLLFLWGLQYTTATAAGVIGSTLPALIALLAIWLLKEKLNATKLLALVLAIMGIVVINLDHFATPLSVQHSYLGDFLIFLAMIPEAAYSIINRKLSDRITPLGGAFVANLVGFLTLFPCALLSGSIDFSIFQTWQGGLVVVASLSSLLFFWGWAFGLSIVPASNAAIFGGIMPLTCTVLAIFFLGEKLHWYDLAGMLLVIASIAIGALKTRERKTAASLEGAPSASI